MRYLVTFTVNGNSDGQEFDSLPDVYAAMQDFAQAAFESGQADEFAIHFDNPEE